MCARYCKPRRRLASTAPPSGPGPIAPGCESRWQVDPHRPLFSKAIPFAFSRTFTGILRQDRLQQIRRSRSVIRGSLRWARCRLCVHRNIRQLRGYAGSHNRSLASACPFGVGATARVAACRPHAARCAGENRSGCAVVLRLASNRPMVVQGSTRPSIQSRRPALPQPSGPYVPFHRVI